MFSGRRRSRFTTRLSSSTASCQTDSDCQHGPDASAFLSFVAVSAPAESAAGSAASLKRFHLKPYQVSPFRSCVFSSAATSPLWVSRSAAPPSAIFTRTWPAALWESVGRHWGNVECDANRDSQSQAQEPHRRMTTPSGGSFLENGSKVLHHCSRYWCRRTVPLEIKSLQLTHLFVQQGAPFY